MKTFAALAALLVSASATPAQKTEVAQIMGGMMKQYGLKINIPALLACIGDEDKALIFADEGVQILEEAYETKNI
jgi:hypothetical protein